ncbi:hypothetical protein ACWEN3_05710 [Streptomyces sp. NPDC004561]
MSTGTREITQALKTARAYLATEAGWSEPSLPVPKGSNGTAACVRLPEPSAS